MSQEIENNFEERKKDWDLRSEERRVGKRV